MKALLSLVSKDTPRKQDCKPCSLSSTIFPHPANADISAEAEKEHENTDLKELPCRCSRSSVHCTRITVSGDTYFVIRIGDGYTRAELETRFVDLS